MIQHLYRNQAASRRHSPVNPARRNAAPANHSRDMCPMSIVIIGQSPMTDKILEGNDSIFKILMGINPCVQHSHPHPRTCHPQRIQIFTVNFSSCLIHIGISPFLFRIFRFLAAGAWEEYHLFCSIYPIKTFFISRISSYHFLKTSCPATFPFPLPQQIIISG